MARPLRIEFSGAWYHVMNRGAGRKKIFKTKNHRNYFLSLLSDVTQRFGAQMHAYCLMDNHYHLMIHTPEGNLQRIMRHINGLYTQYYNRDQHTDGPLFRGRYKAILVDADSYWLALSKYIHRNPLEAGMVRKLETYPWSSYPAYISKVAKPEWLITGSVLSAVSGTRRSIRYQHYIESGPDSELNDFYGKAKRSPILGADAFKKKTLKKQRPNPKDKPDFHHIYRPPSLKRIIQSVANGFNVRESDIRQAKRGPVNKNWPRQMAMYLCQHSGRMSLQSIADAFNVSHYATVSRAIGDFKKAMSEDDKLAKQLIHLTQELTP